MYITKSAKDFFQDDLDVMLNLEEFAEERNIDGTILNVVIDNDRLQERAKKEYEGIYVGDILYYAKVSDYKENNMKKPKPDSIQSFNRKQYIVFDIREDNGLYEIILKYNGN
ncbi:hypothetical protein [Clostridium cylindrosporum]|uniref:Uncharacterized protein n=1 Tax=Clostridium cylindrosporum DSM 605 TaxID=1121307 RepID=A0A0J8DFK6_CLOCY|nr:hypothetical protein [Clostridium cylindrosporum]KMT23004.1 hypothetical protein CLCY_7c00510 [Clostridium cylindrosporum DSM 605]